MPKELLNQGLGFSAKGSALTDLSGAHPGHFFKDIQVILLLN